MKTLLTFLTASLLITSSAFADQVDGNYDANNCEFYVNGLVLTDAYYVFNWSYITTYISVNEQSLVAEQGGTIRHVGVLANGQDEFLGTAIAPAYYAVTVDLIPLVDTGEGGYEVGPAYELNRLAFFVDVERANGRVERLWISNGGQDYSWPNVFNNYPSVDSYQGNTRHTALRNDAEHPSPIFNQRLACHQ